MDQVAQLISEQMRSGKSVAAFCRERKLWRLELHPAPLGQTFHGDYVPQDVVPVALTLLLQIPFQGSRMPHHVHGVLLHTMTRNPYGYSVSRVCKAT
jgi:hypothetical protein